MARELCMADNIPCSDAHADIIQLPWLKPHAPAVQLPPSSSSSPCAFNNHGKTGRHYLWQAVAIRAGFLCANGRSP